MSPATIEAISSTTGEQKTDDRDGLSIGGSGAAVPSHMLFGGATDPRIRFARPIPVDVTKEDGTIVVSWAEVNEFGYGPTLSAALEDLAGSLTELFFTLRSESTLGPDLDKTCSILTEYISDRP